MAEAKTFDPMNVSVIVAGTYLTGFGESMVEAEQSENNYEVKVGAQGDKLRTKTNNNTGTITVTLQATSPQVAYLDRLANSGQIVPITVINAGPPKETITSVEAYVNKPAARTYGTDIDDREYEFQCMDISFN
ncbi:phage structural protein [Paenibacillus sepulcri]|uniref:DUF3277 family protein n=1 Tax=Paenibacillus sepulcri TaxID=359917 RepID=A0ABS7BUW2_9BACL|nr:DUF3277 family protein [Paenibacillus sepulcri]